MLLAPISLLLTTVPSGDAQAQPAFDDYASLLRQLGIKAVRRGPDPNHPDTYNEELANRWLDTLPDLLTTKTGKRVSTASEWTSRRAEIAEDFEREVYGRVPKRTPKVAWEVTGVVPGMSGSIPTVTRTLVGRVDNRAYPSVKVEIQASYTVPVHSQGQVPIIVEFGGFSFLARPGRPSVGDLAIANGWGYGSISPNSIQADNAAGLNAGIIGLVNRGQPRRPDDWGALRAWAWGLSRFIDYFEATPAANVDSKRVGIAGVSRYGKAALVAQAFDPRVAVGLIASSGEGGTKLHRRLFGERVENLAGGSFYWMAGNFIKYGASEPERTAADLPVDSHQLLALCAPRPVFVSHGVPEKGDAHWIDAGGSYMATLLAGPAYRLLGKRDLGVEGDFRTATKPEVGKLVGGDLAWRQHEGGHEIGPNWAPFFEWVKDYVPSGSPLPGAPYRVRADEPSPRTDENSQLAHRELLAKAKKGGVDVYFAGDSITRRWGTSDDAWKALYRNWRENFWGWNAGNFGWGGDSTQHILWRLKNGEMDGLKPKAIVLLAGTNNLAAPNPDAREISRGVRAIVRELRKRAPQATLIVTAIFPRDDRPEYMPIIDRVNRNLARLADGKQIRFVNVNDRMTDREGKLLDGVMIDGLHPGVEGYRIWADALRPILREVLGPRAKEDTAPPPTGDPSARKSG
jgi:lysophospholipase L1-like esterase